MSLHWHIISDDIMEQMELIQMISIGTHSCSILPPANETFDQNQSVCILLNVHTRSFDAITYLQTNASTHHPYQIIAYTAEIHDHQTIHAIKSKGVRLICTKAQLITFLKNIRDHQRM
jgi:hypothetical protein